MSLRRDLHQHRLQQPLALQRAGGQPLGDPLEQHPLVRDVLVDDGDALVVHRHDERVAELAERHQRAGRAGGDAQAAVGRNLRGRGPFAFAPGLRPPAGKDGGIGGRERHGQRQRRLLGDGGRRGRAEGEGRHRRTAQRVGHRHPHARVQERLVAKAHLGLGRVHVHVHGIERHLDEQVHLRAAFLDRGRAVGVADRVRDGLVAHHPPVDEHVLRPARHGGRQRRDHAVDRQTAGAPLNRHQIGAVAVDLEQPVAQAGRGRVFEPAPAGRGEREPDVHVAQRHLRHRRA